MPKKGSETNKNLLAITGGVAVVGSLGYLLVQKLVANVKVDVGNPTIDTTPFLNGYLRTNVPLVVTNNNYFDIGITSFFGKVNYGQLDIANVSIPYGFTIPSKTTNTVTLNMDIPILEVLNDIGLLISNGSVFDAILNKIELNGSILIKGRVAQAKIPLNNITIPIV
jgi:hypothetical protein